MLVLTCPSCNVAGAETEFHAGGEAHLRRAGPEAGDEAFEAYLFHRRNPKGLHVERWRHQYGCGKWFNVIRDTVTMQVFASYPATGRPPVEFAARLGGAEA